MPFKTRTGQSIPADVLARIVEHRPHLQTIVENIKRAPCHAQQFEKAIADSYLAGETRLTMIETWKLGSCCTGETYGANCAASKEA